MKRTTTNFKTNYTEFFLRQYNNIKNAIKSTVKDERKGFKTTNSWLKKQTNQY